MPNKTSVRRSSSVKMPWTGNPTIGEMQAFLEACRDEGAHESQTIMASLGTVPGDRPGLPETTITGLHVSVEKVI